MNAVLRGDVLDPERNLREWARRGGAHPQAGSPAAAMQWAVTEIERLRTDLAEATAETDRALVRVTRLLEEKEGRS